MPLHITLLRLVSRGRLWLTTFVFVAIIAGCRIALERSEAFSFASISQPYQASFYAAAIFVQAAMLASAISDYKLAEALPGSMAASLETLMCAVVLALEDEASEAGEGLRLHTGALLGHILGVIDAQLGMVLRSREPSALARVWEETGHHARGACMLLRKCGAREEAKAMLDTAAGLRVAVARFIIVSQTDFLVSGYPLYYSIVLLTAASTLLTSFDSPSEKWVVLATLNGLFIYLLLLIREVDSPLHLPAFKSAAALVAASGGSLLSQERSSHRRGLGWDEQLSVTSNDFRTIAPLIVVRSCVVDYLARRPEWGAAAMVTLYGSGSPGGDPTVGRAVFA